MTGSILADENVWMLGVILNVIGSVTINFGTNLMKSSHNVANNASQYAVLEGGTGNAASVPRKDQPLRGLEDMTRHAEVVWRLGMTVFVLGSVVNFVSFAFAAQSLLACLGTVQFISNVFFAKLVLKETLTTRIIHATAIIIFGLTLAILYSNHSEHSYNAAELRSLYTTKYIYFTIGELVFLAGLQYVYSTYINSAQRGIRLPAHGMVVPCCYAQISATVGTQSLLQSKCMAELLKATIEGDNQLTNWFTYVIILGFVSGISFWLYRMNSALKQFDGLIIIPLLQVCWTTSAILQGGMYFQEFEKFTITQIIGFSTGVIVVFFGVYLLVPPGTNVKDSGRRSSDDLHIDLEGAVGLLSTAGGEVSMVELQQ